MNLIHRLALSERPTFQKATEGKQHGTALDAICMRRLHMLQSVWERWSGQRERHFPIKCRVPCSRTNLLLISIKRC